MFSRNIRKFSSCCYNEPFIFGPITSTLFFGGLYTGIIIKTVTNSHLIIKEDLKIIKDEIKSKK